MEDVRRHEHILTSMYTINFMKTHYNDWLLQYQANKPNHTRPCCVCAKRFAHRHRFSQHVACHFMLPTSDMVQIRDNFASKIGGKYDGHNLRDIINVDETFVYYDMPPGKIWAELKKSSKVDKAQKHSDRFTAVLSCRINGKKLPTMFIFDGTPGGPIDQRELRTYRRMWRLYLDVLPSHVLGPSVILADNFTPTCYKCRRIPSSVTCAVHWSRCLQIAQVCVSHLT
ncbi:hypothetical protein AaE_004021 [Aphanomyces astaci]|uniref:C2H2-type domain-containing protein n=1 Tax=Aphanomyces astaci TaxID=112090 RepID=A0A6A5ANR3_APHAT|nr:hypothetical protein AaE_004021 [Aphanomyces astaci]